MAVVGVVLLPDDLGRAYAAALIPGAGLLALGGWWTHQAGAIGGELPAAIQPPPVPAASQPAPASAVGAALEPVVATAFGTAGGTAGGAAVGAASGGAPGGGVPSESISAAPPSPAPAPAKSATARSARTAAKARKAATAECPWCSAQIAAGLDRCPSCGAALTEGAELAVIAIPGVTDVAPELRSYQEKVERQKKRVGILSMVLSNSDDALFAGSGGPVDAGAVRPPSADVKAEMERFDREISAAREAGAAAARGAEAEAAAGEAAAGEAAVARGAEGEAAPAETATAATPAGAPETPAVPESEPAKVAETEADSSPASGA
jgi:ribosomal protein L37AE/L43A